ncbi:MAG TPA: hypothetical protein VE153_18895 [Myxococcus sp.]|jgi:hypothetical protein|nr:hypothetical protein [Myxococcus sp.]
MRIRYRLMWAGAVALTVSLVTVWLWPESAVAPVAVLPGMPVAPATRPPAPEPEPARVAAAAPVEATPVAPGPEAPAATVVALGPGDAVPEPEVANPPPQVNDAIEPELPQTPQWRLEKTAHVTMLLGRDVERMEREREQAEARGDDARGEELELLIRRNRARLHELREEMRELSDAIREESSGQ